MSDAGERCLERGFLEIEHRTPVARGGEATVENTRLLCKPQNRYEAEPDMESDALLGLRGLGVTPAEARTGPSR